MLKSINELKLWDKNPRSIDKKGFARLIAQLQRVKEITGEYLYKPLLITPDNVVIGGNMRLRALKELGEVRVWVNVVNVKNEQEMLEVALSDNDQAGKTEKDLLLELIEQYPEIKLGDYAVSFDQPTTLEDFMAQFKEIEEDEVPEVSDEEPISKYGEVYQLGRHRLMCGDATKIEDVEKLMNGQKADMVFTDPPYGVSYESHRKPEEKRFDMIENDDKLLAEWITPALSYSSGWFIFCTSWKVLRSWLDIGDQIGKLTNMIIWDKGGGGIGDLKTTLAVDFEVILAYNRGNEIPGKRIGSVWSVGKDGAMDYTHPTQKPVALPAFAIQNLSTGSILDLFGGSGSTLIACEQTDHTCYMMELDPKYCDVIRKRYENFTNKETR